MLLFSPSDTANELLPPDKRTPYWIGWFSGLASVMDWLQGIFFRYVYGSEYLVWNGSVTYGLGARVKNYYGVYESLVSSNHGHAVTDVNYWLKILNSPIGIIERASVFTGRIGLEWILNRQYLTTFRQPTRYTLAGQMPRSNIYILTIAPSFESYVLYENNSNPASVLKEGGGMFVMFEPPAVVSGSSSFTFSINIPSSIYSSIGSTSILPTAKVKNKGTGWSIGDVFTIVGGTATGKVLSVDGIGGVLSFVILTYGTGYTDGVKTTTGGTGLTVIVQTPASINVRNFMSTYLKAGTNFIILTY